MYNKGLAFTEELCYGKVMNLGNILTLLQLVLALLSNPTTAQNPQVQALAIQAINDAASVLSAQASSTQVSSSTISLSIPTSTDNPQPIVINVTNPPCSAGSSIPCTLQPSTPQDNQNLGVAPVAPPSTCNLVGTIMSLNGGKTDGSFNGATVQLSWDTLGFSGTLDSLGIVNGSLVDAGPQGHFIHVSSNQTSTVYGFEPIYKMTFDSGATCFAFFPDYLNNGSNPNVGDVSTSIEPSGYPAVQ